MKRTLLFSLLMLAALATQAQPHVEAAFRALVTANGGQMPEERLMEGGSDQRFTLTMHKSFTLRPEQYNLITALQKAMDTDRTWRTQYRLSDAFSGREWTLDIETPHFRLHEESEESVNKLMGGFFVPEKAPRPRLHGTQPIDTSLVRLYRYYVLTYQEDLEGNLTGSVQRITFDADTQEPHIQEPSVPKYQPLIDAITAFGADDKIIMRRNLSERRAAASGQWTHIYNTLGFNMPLDDEVRLLGPLWKAFLTEQPGAYRSLSKPAGQVASDVQIIYDEQGHTLGLGSQQQWNITYLYFNDPDFPSNRYVYALWYKPDVPRQRIVGELIKINTLRPEGTPVKWPFIQRTVPTYLWRLSLNPIDQRVPSDNEFMGLPSYAASPDFARMQGILQDIPGLDLRPLRFMLDTLMQRRISELDTYTVEVIDLSERYRESLLGLSGMLKLNISADEYERMTPQERIDLNEQARQQYHEERDRVERMYREYMDNVARRHPMDDLNIFRRDSVPNDVFRSAFEVLTMAYRGDASERDAEVAERLRQMAEMAADEASRPVRLTMYHRLDSIINLPHPNMPGNLLLPSRQSLAEAVMALDVQPAESVNYAEDLAPYPKDFKDLKDVNDLKVKVIAPDKVALTLPNGNSITTGKIRVKPFKGSVLGTPGAKMTVRQGKRMVRRAERRIKRFQRRLDRQF